MTPPRITLAGLDFHGAAAADGTRHYATRLDGWDAPDVRQELMETAGHHGATLLSNLLAHRAMTLAGYSVAPPGVDVNVVASELAGTLNLLRPDTRLTVHEPTPKWAGVARAGRFRHRIVGNHIEWELPLIAPDPRKYATTRTRIDGIGNGATVTVRNGGTFITWPEVIVQGPGTAPVRVRNSSTRMPSGNTIAIEMRANRSLGSNANLYFQMQEKRLRLNQGLRYDLLDPVYSRWWWLEPGDNSIYVSGGTGIVQFYDAWV